MSRFRLIVGLGNPGKEYEHTRHNLGFFVVKELAKRYQIKLSRKLLLKGRLGEGQIGENDFCLFCPLTYMNNSGLAVRRVFNIKKIDLSNLLIVCDDLNLDFGQLRLRNAGSHGGHKGLGSLIDHLKTDQFARLRMGIGLPKGREDASDFVLSEFTKDEKGELEVFIQEAAHCCEVWLTEGEQKAMSLFNKRKGNE